MNIKFNKGGFSIVCLAIVLCVLSLSVEFVWAAGVENLWPGTDGRGVPICKVSWSQDSPLITTGSTDAIIFWQDGRVETEYNTYAQKVNKYGAILWTLNGVLVSTSEFGIASWEYSSAVAHDGSGGGVFVWKDQQMINTAIGASKIKAQRLDSAGAKIWTPSTGVTLAFASGEVHFGGKDAQKEKLVFDDLKTYFIFFYSKIVGNNYDLYAQKVWMPPGISGGSILWPTGSPTTEGKVICDANSHQGLVRDAVPDGSGGAIVAWSDSRPFPPGESGVYATKVNSDGITQWPTLGSKSGVPVFFGISGAPGELHVLEDGSGGAIIAMIKSGGVYVQRLDAGGVRRWGDAGIKIRSASALGAQHLDIQPDGMGGAIVAWKDKRNGVNTSIVTVQRVDGTGQILWPPSSPTTEGYVIEEPPKTVGSTVYDHVEACPDGKGGAVFVWSHPVVIPSHDELWAQRLDPNANILWPLGSPTNVGLPVFPVSNDYTGLYKEGFSGTDGMGGAIVAISIGNIGWSTTTDIYVTRLMGDDISPEVTVSSPPSSDPHYWNGTHYWQTGTPATISWSVSEPIPTENGISSDAVNISYTTDEVNFISIASNQPLSGSTGWSVPAGESTLGAIRIEAADKAGTINTDGSPNVGTFDILFDIDNVPPTVESVSPTNEGQATAFGQPIIIQFNDASPMNRAAVQNAIKIYPPLQNLSYLWSDNDRNVAIWHAPFSPLTTYEVTIETTAADMAGNTLATPFTWEFMSPPYLGDPLIDRITFDGRKYFTVSGYGSAYERDIVTSSPKIGFRIFSLAGISTESITLTIDEPLGAIYYVPSSYFSFTAGSTTEGFVTNFPINLSPANHLLRIRAKNNDGIEGISEDIRVRVYGGTVKLVPGTEILTLPSPFKPLTGTEPLTISYVLTTNANISVLIYSASGQIILKKNFRSASQGGRAGYNSFQWNGVTDFGKRPGNGIYVIKIVSGNRAVGTGKLVVFE